MESQCLETDIAVIAKPGVSGLVFPVSLKFFHFSTIVSNFYSFAKISVYDGLEENSSPLIV